MTQQFNTAHSFLKFNLMSSTRLTHFDALNALVTSTSCITLLLSSIAVLSLTSTLYVANIHLAFLCTLTHFDFYNNTLIHFYSLTSESHCVVAVTLTSTIMAVQSKAKIYVMTYVQQLMLNPVKTKSQSAFVFSLLQELLTEVSEL